MVCGLRYENLIGEERICGDVIYDSQGIHTCMCNKCREDAISGNSEVEE